MGAVKKITLISIIGAAILGMFNKIGFSKKCIGMKVKRKNIWKMKQKSLAMLLKSIMRLFKAKRESKNVWRKIFQSA